MALASERRVATLVDKLFCHSVILRAPVCRLLSDQWSSLKAAAATELLAIGAGCTATTNYTLPAEMLYALRITKAVLPIAIEQCLMSQPTDAVLLAFREVALSRSRGQEMGTVVYNKLQQLLPCSFCIPTACRLKYCGECDGTLTALFSGYPSCGTAPCMIHRNRLANPSLMSPSEHISWTGLYPIMANTSWNAFIHRATSSERSLCSLRDLCLDALRMAQLQSFHLDLNNRNPLRLHHRDPLLQNLYSIFDTPVSLAIPCSNANECLGPDRLPFAQRIRYDIDGEIRRRLRALGPVCFQPHDRLCSGPLALYPAGLSRPACGRDLDDRPYNPLDCKPGTYCKGGHHEWERRDCSSAALNVLFESCPQWVDTFVATTRPNSPLPPMPPDDCADMPIHGDTWHRDPDEHWDHVFEWRERQPWWQ